MTLRKLINFLRPKPYLITAAVFAVTAVLSYAPGTNKTYTTNNRTYDEESGAVLGIKALLALPTPAAKPQIVAPTPQLAAKSAIVLEPSSHTVLWGKNAHLRLPPASTTKIATAIVTLETRSLDEVVSVPETLIAETPGAWMDLRPGQQITVEKPLRGMLVHSANDAAFTVAETHPTGVLVAMNALVSELGLEDTHFVNPIGFDDPNHYSSAYDLAVLADYAMQNPKFAEIVKTQEGNTNQLLGAVAGVNGVKTGYTLLARGVLVVSAKRDRNQIIVVVMGSENREAEAAKLVEWAYSSVAW